MAKGYLQRHGMPETRISFPRMTQQSLRREGEGAFVQFAGRPAPVGARPARRPARVWEIEVTLARDEHHLARDLDELLGEAFYSSDGRLDFVPDSGKDDAVHPRTVVEVHEWDMGREPGGIVRISFQAQEVDA